MTSFGGYVQQESTYYPFGGEQRVITNTVDNRYKFAGMYRDSTTGLDHTLFRNYAQNFGRWYTPDPLLCGSPVSATEAIYLTKGLLPRIFPPSSIV